MAVERRRRLRVSACACGGIGEPGLAGDLDAAPLLVLPPGMELRKQRGPQQHTQQCAFGRALLQLPPGVARLARTNPMEAARGSWLLPDGALLRLPLVQTRGVTATGREPSPAACAADAGGGDSEFARGVLASLHARCALPAGALLAATSRLGSLAINGSSVGGGGDAAEPDPGGVAAPSEARMRAGCTSREESTDGGHRRAWLRTRRLSTPRAHGGGGRPAVWMASAAVQPRSRASSALDGASLLAQLRRPNATAAQRTAPNLWPTLSALFPLPSSRDLPLASRTALNQLAAQLDRLDAGGGGDGVHRVQLLLLGHRRLCDESDDVISLLYNHPNAIHLALETAVDATSSPSSTAAGTDRLARLAPFTADVMLAWAMLSPSGVRLYADGSSRLPDGALRARLDLLRRHASCDAMFVPAGATLGGGDPHVPSSRSRAAGGAYDAVAVRSWQLFDEPRPAAGAAPPGGGTRSTLEHAAVAQARVPRGAWPLWQGTSLPEGCRVGTSATTEAAAAAAAAGEHDAAAAAAAAAAEVDYWLGCLQAGAVLCLAAPSATPLPPRSHVASSAEDEEDESVTAVTPGGIDTAPTERHAVAAASTISDVDGSGSDGWVEEAAGVVEGEALQMILRRRNRLAALGVLVVANSLPKHSLSDGGGDVRDYQLVNELAAEGHSVTVVHSQPSRSVDVAALRDAGWRAFCPACLLPTAARCPECEDVQSATFVRCRLQAAARAPSRVAIIRAEDERELSAEAFDLVVILVAPDGASCNGTSGMAERILSSALSEKPSATRPRLLALTDGLPQLAPAAAAAAAATPAAAGRRPGAPAAPFFYTGAKVTTAAPLPRPPPTRRRRRPCARNAWASTRESTSLWRSPTRIAEHSAEPGPPYRCAPCRLPSRRPAPRLSPRALTSDCPS